MTRKKNKFKKVLVIVLLTTAIIIEGKFLALAQWQNPPTSGSWNNRFANTWATGANGNWTRSVGVGDFRGNFAYPNSFLHINSNYLLLPTNGTINNFGEVFRSDCPALNTPFWRMFRGGIEMANFSSPVSSPTGSSTDFVIETMQPFSNMLFKVGYGANRMIITDGKPLINNQTGLVGIGANFYTPQSMLHVNGNDLSTYVRITNNWTGQTNGLLLGVEFNGQASVRFINNQPLNILTNDIKRMFIAAGGNTMNDGFIAIGNDFLLPNSRLHLHQNGNNFVYTQWTNDITQNINELDGFRIGIASTGEAELRQQENTDMLFYTGDAQSGLLNNIRMAIKGQPGPTQGFIGIGDGFVDPQSVLHLNIGGLSDVFTQWTNGTIGNTVNDGLRIGIFSSGIAELHQQENSQIDIFTNSGINHTRKMRIWHDATNNEARIGIGAVINPRTFLHIGDEINVGANQQGYRTWMNTGVFCVESNNGTQADNMYIGLRRIDSDETDAIINWGNNPTIQPTIADRLRFVFTAGTILNLPAAGLDGLETARIISDGRSSQFGIGDFFTLGLEPKHQLDVYDDGLLDPNGNPITGGRPQLRLTQQLNPGIIAGNFTDFQTTGPNNNYDADGTGTEGNLLINPRSNGLHRAVAINMENNATAPYAGLALDVNGQMDIRTVNTDPFGNLEALVWDPARGRVYRRNIIGGGGFGAACTPPAIPFNLADDWRVGLGNYNLYFAGPSLGMPSLPNTNSVGIGWDCSVLSAKLDVLQNSLNPNTIGISVINRDPSSGIWGALIPVIGLKSLMPLTSANSNSFYKIAGWFEVPSNPASTPGYAVYVPLNGGSVNIGYNFSSATPNWLLDVNGSIHTPTWTSPSDSILKNNVAPLLYGIDVLRNINVVSYSYNGKGGYNTTDKYVGIIAEQLANVAPYAIDTSFILLDSTDTQLTPVLNVDQGALMYTSINAIKELDSIITYYLPHLPPLPPVLALPQNGAANVEIKPLVLAWYKNPNAEWYQIELALDNSFEKPVFIKETFDTMLFTGVDKYNTTYYWRVMAFNKKGKSAYSQVFSFTTKPVPGTATLIAPENGAVNVPLEAPFMWSNGMPVHKNIIEVAFDSDFRELVRQFATPDSSVTMFLEKDETVHYWRVTTYVFPESSEGAVSETWSFTTQPKGFVMDTVYGTEYRSASDINFKTNIAAIDNPLDKVLQLNGISYNWRINDFPQYNFGNSRQLGFNGQEVEQVVPEVVSRDANGYYSVDYGKLNPLLVEAIKVLSARLDALEGSLLQKENGETGETGSTLEKTIKYIELSSKSIVLEQNVPNPFAESTSIDYSVPEDAGFVQIIFTDKAGRIIRAVDIEERGNGQLVVYAQNLSAGMYSYTIVVDGEQIVTRKMIKVSK